MINLDVDFFRLAIKEFKIKFLKNFSFLALYELIRLLTPFITYPYLISCLGGERFGLVIFAQNVASYFSIFINYGFNISAVQQVAINRNNKIKLSETVSTVFVVKFFFFVISLLIMFILIEFVNSFKSESLLFVYSMGYCLYEAIIPVWFFQGIEKMKNITIVHFFSKVFFVLGVFFLIKKESDYVYVPLINVVGAIIGGLISAYILFVRYKIKFKYQLFSLPILNTLKFGFPLFLSRLTSVFNVSFGKIFVGLSLGMNEVAVYDIATKIIELFKIPFSLINQVIFPEISRTKDMRLVKHWLNIVLVFGSIFILIISLMGGQFFKLIAGVELEEGYTTLMFLSPIIVFSGLNFFLGNTVLVVNNYLKSFNLSVILGASIFALLLLLMWILDIISLTSIAVSNVMGFMIVFFVRFYFSKKFFLK